LKALEKKGVVLQAGVLGLTLLGVDAPAAEWVGDLGSAQAGGAGGELLAVLEVDFEEEAVEGGVEGAVSGGGGLG